MVLKYLRLNVISTHISECNLHNSYQFIIGHLIAVFMLRIKINSLDRGLKKSAILHLIFITGSRDEAFALLLVQNVSQRLLIGYQLIKDVLTIAQTTISCKPCQYGLHSLHCLSLTDHLTSLLSDKCLIKFTST